MYVFLCPMKMESFTLPRLFSLLFLIISVLYQLLNFSEACFLGNPTLDLIHSAKKESLELTSTRGDLRKSKSLPNLNYLQESIPLTDGRTSAAFSTNLPKTPKTDSEGVPFNDLLSEERLNVQKDDRSKKKERVDFEKPTVTRPSESYSSHSYQPVNLLPPNENLQRPPTYPASYHPGIAPANNQGAQVFPSFSYPPSLTGLTPQSPFVLYGQPGILYTVIEGNPSDVIAPAILSNSHPHNYPVAPQYGYGAPSHIPPNNFYDPHLQAQHSSPFSAHSQGSYQTANTIYAESQDSQNYFGPSSLPNYHTGDAPGLRNPNFYSNPLAQNSEFYSSFATTSQRVPPTKATTGTLFSIPIRERSSFKKLRGEFSRNNRHQAFKFKNGEKHSSSIREKNDSASKKSTGLDDFQNYNDLRSQNDAHNSRRRNDIDNSDIENKVWISKNPSNSEAEKDSSQISPTIKFGDLSELTPHEIEKAQRLYGPKHNINKGSVEHVTIEDSHKYNPLGQGLNTEPYQKEREKSSAEFPDLKIKSQTIQKETSKLTESKKSEIEFLADHEFPKLSETIQIEKPKNFIQPKVEKQITNFDIYVNELSIKKKLPKKQKKKPDYEKGAKKLVKHMAYDNKEGLKDLKKYLYNYLETPLNPKDLNKPTKEFSMKPKKQTLDNGSNSNPRKLNILSPDSLEASATEASNKEKNKPETINDHGVFLISDMAQKENFGQKTKSSIEIAEEKTLNLKKGNDLSSQMLTKQSYKPSIHFRTSTINKKYVEKKENSIMIDEKSKIQKMQSKPETESNEKNNAVPKENLLRNQNQNLVVKSQEEHIKVGPKPDILDGSKKKDEIKEQSVKEAQKVGLSQEGNFFENNYSNEFKNKATKSNTRIKEAQPELFSVSNPKIDTLKPFEEFEHSIKYPPENHKELETTEISNLEKAQINPQKIDSEGNKLKSSSKTESGGKVFSSEEIDLVNSKIPNTGELSSSRIDHKKQLSKKKKVKGNEKLKVNTLYNPNEKTKPSKVTLKDFFQALDQHISAPGNSVSQETKKTLISGDLIQVDNSINENKNLPNNVEVKSDLLKKEEMLEYRNLHSYSEVKPEQSNSLSFKDHMEKNIIKQKDDNNSSKIHTSLLRNLPESSTLSYVNNNALSVDPLAVAHSKNLETPFKSEAEAVSIRTLKEYFQNSDNPKRIALKTWESWKTKKLDPEMMYHLAVDLNLKESQMADVPLDLINDIRIKKLLEYIAKNLEDYKRAEEWFIESMIPHEGNRRMIALRNQIKQYTVINKWKTLSSKLLKKFPKHKDYINSLDHQYGITLGEPSVLANKDFSPLKDPEGFDSFVIIERVFGYEEAKNRWELLEFVKKRSAQIKWCFEDPKYNLADLRYGVSFIRALKAADSLQFGRQLWFGFDWGRISIEDRFYTLLEAMSPLNNYMLWNESAERIWILNFNNKNYEKKLGDFCLLVTKNQKILKEQISNSATKMKDFEDKTGVSINDPALDSLGDIFICFEIGLYIPEILNMKRKLASVIEIIENVETVEDMETCKDLIDLFSDSKSKMLISIIFAWFPKALNNDEIGGLIGFKHSMMTEEEKFFFLRQVKLSRLYFNEEIPVWCQQLSVFFNSDHGSARKIKH